MVVLRDVTDRKRYEALMSQSNAELEARVMERTAALEQESLRREEARAALIQAQRMEPSASSQVELRTISIICWRSSWVILSFWMRAQPKRMRVT